MKFTIEELLEISVKQIQDTRCSDEQNKQAHKDLMLVCAGIIAGIKSVKQEKQDDNTLSSSSEAE